MKKNKTVTGFLTRGKGQTSWEVKLFPMPKLSEMFGEYFLAKEKRWHINKFNKYYTCVGFKLKPGDCILVEMET